MGPVVTDDTGIIIPPTPDGLSDGYPSGTLPSYETSSLIPSNPKLPGRTWPSPVPTQVAKTTKGQKKDCQRLMTQTLDLHMDPTEPRKRRCFSKIEKEHMKQVRKMGACATCRKKKRKVGEVILALWGGEIRDAHKRQCSHATNPEESHAASPDSNGPETPVSDNIEHVQVLSPSRSFDRDI